MTLVNICCILISIANFPDGENPYELFSIGSQLELSGKIEEAIEYYRKVIQIDSTSAETYLSLVNAYYLLRKFNEGINTAQQGLAVLHDNAQLYLAIAAGYIGKGDLKNSIKYYKQALTIEPDNIEISNTISLLYENLSDFNNAREILEVVPESIKTAEVYVKIGSLSGQLKNHKEAIEYFRQGYEMDTTNLTALIGISTGFDFLGIKDSAIYYYERSLEKDTTNLSVYKRLVELYSDLDQYEKVIVICQKVLALDYYDVYIRRNLGFALYKTGMMLLALNEFLIAAKIDQQDSYSRFYAGRIYLEQNNLTAAQREITEAIGINPDFIELWIYLCFVSIDLKDFKTAKYALTEAAYRGGDFAEVFYLLGVIAEIEEEQSDAYFYYQKSLRGDPKNLVNLETLANLCERLDRKEEALKNFEKIIVLDSTNGIALNYVGYSYAEQNYNLEYALELIDKALAIENDNGYYLDSRGWVFYQMGRYEEALVEVKRASELVEDKIILEHLGDVYMKLNDQMQAKQAYEKALILDSKNKAVNEKLLKIKGD